jgi:hypothetical protein
MSRRKHTGDVTTVPLDQWQENVDVMTARELYFISDMLASMIRHPVNAGRRHWMGAAIDRLQVVTTEQDRRWFALVQDFNMSV